MGVTLVVAISTLPAVAQAKTVPVDGDRFPKTVVRKVMACNSPTGKPKQKPAFVISRGPGNAPIGNYSAGWKPGSKGFGGVALAYIASPTTLSTLQVDANAPGETARATAVAIYQPPNDDGHWVGLGQLPQDTDQGWRRFDAGGVRYSWYHFTSAGVQDTTAAANPIQAHAGFQGGDGEGARVGFIVGCDRKKTFIDRLRVITSSENDVYDFGGYRTTAGLRLGTSKVSKKTITFGQNVKLNGRLSEQFTDKRIKASLPFQVKPSGQGKWRTFAKDGTSATRQASVRVSPGQHSVYRVSYPGTPAKYENDVSNLVKILVQIKVNAGFRDRSIYKGQRWTVAGRVAPGKRTKVELQRYVDGKWRHRGRTQTQRDGSFTFSAKATEISVSHWRVKAEGNRTILDGASNAFRLRVEKRPPPSGGGGGGGGGGTNPPPPPVDPPPPPPEG